MTQLILGSSSPARKKLLTTLALPFSVVSPDVDETPLDNESPLAMVTRLAQLKANKISKLHPNAVVIGCDQMLECDGRVLGKPENHAAAVEQLSFMSEKQVVSYTAMCLIHGENNQQETIVENYSVWFRSLTIKTIENYLAKDDPYHCAGSLKVESLGIALIAKMSGEDPNALTGLPLIKLVTMLQKFNIFIP